MSSSQSSLPSPGARFPHYPRAGGHGASSSVLDTSFDSTDGLASLMTQQSASFQKLVNDPIHGYVKLDFHALQVVDTPQFQRLRDLKQLGLAYYVFPGASHNRFEHCIGVSYLAGHLMRRFRRNQAELEITDREAQLVEIAGLCHDLGHGPFSHMFDGEFIPRARPGCEWAHEQGSVMMLEYMVDENNIDLDEDDVRMVKDLILASDVKPEKPRERAFIYDVIANGRNSVDVDKFDYIARDCHNLGMKSSYDYSRLLNFSRVIDNHIAFHCKEVFNLYEMFHTRYSLHKQVYCHRVTKALEYMVCDALVAADEHLKISSAIDDPAEYTNLTDSILRTIESSKSDELRESRDILRRMRKRQLYKFADEMILPMNVAATAQKLCELDVTTCQDAGDNLRPEDIIVQNLKINYAMKDQNPVDHVYFFNDWESDDMFRIPRQEVSFLIPEHYQERIVRVYCRDPHNLLATQRAFRNAMRRFYSNTPKVPPPSPRKQRPTKRPRV